MDLELQPELQGETLTLRPLQEGDRQALWKVASDPLVWAQHPDQTRFNPEGFARFFEDSLQSRSALVVIATVTGKIIGSSRFYDWDPGKREVAIGYTFLARAFWGGPTNRELKHLMITHAARWADRIWFHVGTQNLRSRRAMEKIGGIAEFEGPRPLHGEMIPFIYYCIDTAKWTQLPASPGD